MLCCCCLAAKSCPTLLQSHGLQPARLLCPWNFQARILEWVAISYSKGSSRPRSPALQEDSLLLSHQGSPLDVQFNISIISLKREEKNKDQKKHFWMALNPILGESLRAIRIALRFWSSLVPP